METYAKGRVYKRGRIWFLDYALDAKRIRESAETTNKAVAERLLASKLAAIDEGSYTHIKKSKLGFAMIFLLSHGVSASYWRPLGPNPATGGKTSFCGKQTGYFLFLSCCFKISAQQYGFRIKSGMTDYRKITRLLSAKYFVEKSNPWI